MLTKKTIKQARRVEQAYREIETGARSTEPQECVCERGHDRPYWTCPKHGYVTVEP